VRESPDHPWQLFNLREDLGESNNLADAEKERLNELAAAFGNWWEDIRTADGR
jgi:hypothetical protein